MTIEDTSITISENSSEYFDAAAAVVAIHFEKNKFGAAANINNELKILSTDNCGINRDFIDMVCLLDTQVKFISSTRSNISSIKQALPVATSLQLVQSIDFTTCTTKELHNEFNVQIDQEMDESNESCFKSLRALLVYLSKTLPANNQIPRNVSVFQIEPSNVVISKSCLQALQIFDSEPHPNMHATHQGFKEGCSIYSLFNQTASEEGRAKLKKWFHHPTNNIQILKNRQDSIEVLMKPEMSSFSKISTKSLKKCTSLSTVITDLKFRPDANGLMKIGRFCDAFHEICVQALDGRVQMFPLIQRLKDNDFTPIFNISQLIRRIIDTESFKASEIYTIREYVNADLDALRRKYCDLPNFLTSIVSEIANGIDSVAVKAVNIVYFPQLGFLITLPLTPLGTEPADLGNQLGFELQFQNLDNTIGDVYADIIDFQLEIMQQIVNQVVLSEILLNEALEICSELDCLISMSKTAQRYSLNRPEIVSDPSVLQIEDGRHLLVELYSHQQCITNDCNLNGEKSKLIITGANSSGKSVYLKQVGIITYLAHIGSFVPARRAKIGLIDRIVTRIKTIESTGKGESCFMIDLKQVKTICDTSTERSLVLIDEFGKGTAQNDGMALFSGLLSYFSRKQVRLLAITHMYEVFRKQLIQNSEEHFKFGHMKVFPDKVGLCYLYKMEQALGTEQSFAIDCARESGISEEIINNAKEILKELQNGASPQDLNLLKTNEQQLIEAVNLIKRI